MSLTTNIQLDETITIYDVAADTFGDEVKGDGHIIPCSVDAEHGWDAGGFQQSNPSTLTVWIRPDDDYYVAKDGRLFGLLAQYKNELAVEDKRSWYKITSVSPGKSIYTGELDLVTLVLQRMETDGSS